MTELETTPQRAEIHTSTPLRQSLVRLDTAARARFVTVGADVEVVVVDVAGRLEARIWSAARGALHNNALVVLGAAVAVGLFAALMTGPSSLRSMSSQRGNSASPTPRKTQ
jgi:hypothetical protein